METESTTATGELDGSWDTNNIPVDVFATLEPEIFSSALMIPLTREISEGVGSLTFESNADLDGMLEVFDSEFSYSGSSDVEEEPSTIAYSSSDDSSVHNGDIASIPSSSSLDQCSSPSSSSDGGNEGNARRKRAPTTKRTPAGLSAQEKREIRKMRNRELAAESRKRKNDEMERLRQENSELKARIAELEKIIGPQSKSKTAPPAKRSRVGTTIGTSAVVVSLAAFVLSAPAEHYPGVSSTASVLVTALDFSEGKLYAMAQMVFTFVLGMVVIAMVGQFLTAAVQRTKQSILNSIRDSFSSSNTLKTRGAIVSTNKAIYRSGA